jgi:hypothetical protein
MPALILISGAGQLGSRYLQGLAKCSNPLKIFVHDFNNESLQNAKKRWDEVLNNNSHDVLYITSLETLPKKIDIAIVSTTADVRIAATRNICKSTNVNYWVLEKVLAQNEDEIDELLSIVNSSRAWVNTPRRLMPWHQEIKSQLDFSNSLNFYVEGGSWGLACNTIHFLDLFSWWTGELLESISTKSLNKNWFKSKRENYWEISGELKAKFSNGSVARIFADQSSDPVLIKVENNSGGSWNYSWLINEVKGLAVRSDGTEISGNLNYQSEITADLIDSILDHGICNLPLLSESAELHRIFIREMHKHWRNSGNPPSTFVPIT